MVTKVLDASKEGKYFINDQIAPKILQSAEEEKMPESTFSLKHATDAENKARDNVELPYFIGEREDVGNKSKLFEVDEQDRLEVLEEEMQDMELEDEEDY
jgi:hypothetical protein